LTETSRHEPSHPLAAGTRTIPGLERATADDLRDRILERLRTPDDL
jgi:membrane protein YdbS with pleckstrin-like domain